MVLLPLDGRPAPKSRPSPCPVTDRLASINHENKGAEGLPESGSSSSGESGNARCPAAKTCRGGPAKVTGRPACPVASGRREGQPGQKGYPGRGSPRPRMAPRWRVRSHPCGRASDRGKQPGCRGFPDGGRHQPESTTEPPDRRCIIPNQGAYGAGCRCELAGCGIASWLQDCELAAGLQSEMAGQRPSQDFKVMSESGWSTPASDRERRSEMAGTWKRGRAGPRRRDIRAATVRAS